MLVLSRKPNEEILIGDNIRLTVVSIQGGQVKLGFVAPPEVPIYRSELLEGAQEQTVSCSKIPAASARPLSRKLRRREPSCDGGRVG